MRNRVVWLFALAAVFTGGHAVEAQTCKVCAEQKAACMKNYAGAACKTEYQMCRRACKQ